MTDGSPLVHRDRHGPVVTLTLDSPKNRNALSARLLAELAAGLDEASDDPDVRVIVVSGNGTTFCSGVDLTERLHPPAQPPPVTLADVLGAIASAPQPVVARVNGHVRAGGMGLVAACDLAAAVAGATFSFSEVRVGVAPAIIAVPALRRMGRRAFERYALTGDVFDAPTAVHAGLLHAAPDDLDALDEWVGSVVRSLLAAAPSAVAATKALPDLVAGPWDDALDAATVLSDDLFAAPAAAEGMAAFLGKRRPAWVLDWPASDPPASERPASG